jgi:hypothetical protein
MSCEIAVDCEPIEEAWMSELDWELPGELTPAQAIDEALALIREAVELLQECRNHDALGILETYAA